MATTEVATAKPDSSTDNNYDAYFDASLFVDETYIEKEFIVGPHTINVLCLQCPFRGLLRPCTFKNFDIVEGRFCY